MTIRWMPDTCDCIIDFETKAPHKFIKWVQKCEGHKDFEGEELKEKVFEHNRSFQISIEDQKNKKKRNQNMKLKREEKLRIKKLGRVTKLGEKSKPSKKGGRG